MRQSTGPGTPVGDDGADVTVLRGTRRVAAHRLAEGAVDRVVVLCHPAPGAGTFDPDPQQTRNSGITLFGIDRPGYGRSEPVSDSDWATVGSAADDIAAVLEHMGVASASVVGWSAGGRVALAFAARHPGLVDRVVVLGTPAPHEEVPWIAAEQEAAMNGLRGMSAAGARGVLADQLKAFAGSGTGGTDALALLAVTAADEQALARQGARERIAGMLTDAFTQGADGLASDILGFSLQPWGFEPAAVRAETLLLYGSADPLAGPQHGSWWRDHLPDASLEVVPGAGHLLILSTWHRVLSWATVREILIDEETG
jgi:pimeloyl-ACP methyl ester carboxylesterase